MDVTTGKCGECGADMTVVATVTDGTNTRYAADADTLNQAVTAILETGSRTFTVEAEDPPTLGTNVFDATDAGLKIQVPGTSAPTTVPFSVVSTASSTPATTALVSV